MQHYVIKFVREHDEGQQFSMGSLVSPINKSDYHCWNIVESGAKNP